MKHKRKSFRGKRSKKSQKRRNKKMNTFRVARGGIRL